MERGAGVKSGAYNNSHDPEAHFRLYSSICNVHFGLIHKYASENRL